MHPLAAFGGQHVFDNFVRLILCMVGIMILVVCVKIGAQSWRLRKEPEERQRAWGVFSFAFIVVAPASGSLTKFGEPLSWRYAIPYLIGLVCACISLSYRVRISAPWVRYWSSRQRHQRHDER